MCSKCTQRRSSGSSQQTCWNSQRCELQCVASNQLLVLYVGWHAASCACFAAPVHMPCCSSSAHAVLDELLKGCTASASQLPTCSHASMAAHPEAAHVACVHKPCTKSSYAKRGILQIASSILIWTPCHEHCAARYFANLARAAGTLDALSPPTKQQLANVYARLCDTPAVPAADLLAACSSAGISADTGKHGGRLCMLY